MSEATDCLLVVRSDYAYISVRDPRSGGRTALPMRPHQLSLSVQPSSLNGCALKSTTVTLVGRTSSTRARGLVLGRARVQVSLVGIVVNLALDL